MAVLGRMIWAKESPFWVWGSVRDIMWRKLEKASEGDGFPIVGWKGTSEKASSKLASIFYLVNCCRKFFLIIGLRLHDTADWQMCPGSLGLHEVEGSWKF